ncbi:MAG TPA: SpoIIE family protein phosphatase [Candidatus Rifleibacterium sp.]|nr:SpoIIE family protein phosphatase [Candidatus Rifleibacterium sp.]HPT44837.1 SpoIIE family protein phosphatase [Candidatus Rifleibacterium sp.]
MNKEHKNKPDFAAWVAFVMFAVLLPLAGAWSGWHYVASLHRDARLRLLQIESNSSLESLQLAADGGKYTCMRIKDVYENCSTPEKLRVGIESLNQEMSLHLNYLIWNGDGSVFHSTFDYQKNNADWPLAFSSFCQIIDSGARLSASATANLRRIYGPQFFPEVFAGCYSGRHIQPLYGDSSSDGRLSWVRVKAGRNGLSVFFSRPALENLPGIEHQISDMVSKSGLQIAIIRNGVLNAQPGLQLDQHEVSGILAEQETPSRVGRWFICKGLVRTGIEAVFLLPATAVDEAFFTPGRSMIVLLLLLGAIFIVRRSFMAFCRGNGVSLSIRKQLIILFVLANAFSLSILAILGFDYLHEYEMLLQAETFRNGMTYLQSIDEMYVAEFSEQLRRIDKGLEGMKTALRARPPDHEMLKTFLNMQRSEPFRLILVGSHTPFIGSDYGVMLEGQFLNRLLGKDNDIKQMKVLVESMGKLGRYYLSLLNRESLEEMVVAQVELIAESLGQLQSIEMFQEFFAATGSFWQWGMGWRFYPAYIQVLRVFDDLKADYVFLYLWEPKTLEYAYLQKMYADLNRNPLGLKIMAVNEDLRFSFPEELLQNEQLLNYTNRLREKTGTEIDFCDWHGQKHLLMGLKCVSLANIRLLALFPLESIERAVRGKFWLFFALGLVSMLVSLALSLVVSRSILRPLGELQTGVLALQKQDFAYRLPDLGGDEFGNLAHIFNTTLVDLEELHTASIVQEKLLDRFAGVLQHGKLGVAGGSLAITRFGGDFLALNPVNERYFGFFIGDVAGSGVASTLVMAFVKACIMQLEEFYLKPAEMLQRIDFLVRSSSGTGQRRKFLSLQYVLLDAETGKITIASAGHCFPLLVMPKNLPRVIEMPSTPIGSGNSTKFLLHEFQPVSGAKLVFYTAGLYLNAELGFESMKKILSELADHDSENFFQAARTAFEKIRDGRGRTDDQTMVVVSMPEGETG